MGVPQGTAMTLPAGCGARLSRSSSSGISPRPWPCPAEGFMSSALQTLLPAVARPLPRPGPIESSRCRIFPLLSFFLHGFLFSQVNWLDVWLCGGLGGWARCWDGSSKHSLHRTCASESGCGFIHNLYASKFGQKQQPRGKTSPW